MQFLLCGSFDSMCWWWRCLDFQLEIFGYCVYNICWICWIGLIDLLFLFMLVFLLWFINFRFWDLTTLVTGVGVYCLFVVVGCD